MTESTASKVEQDLVEVGGYITPNMIADELGTTGKALRRFIRHLVPERAGKGGKWAFTQVEANAIMRLWRARNVGSATRPDLSSFITDDDMLDTDTDTDDDES